MTLYKAEYLEKMKNKIVKKKTNDRRLVSIFPLVLRNRISNNLQVKMISR